jgi:hypothetical protein
MIGSQPCVLDEAAAASQLLAGVTWLQLHSQHATGHDLAVSIRHLHGNILAAAAAAAAAAAPNDTEQATREK